MPCPFCPAPLHEHGKTKIFKDDRPGRWHYKYDECPDDDWGDVRESIANLGDDFMGAFA